MSVDDSQSQGGSGGAPEYDPGNLEDPRVRTTRMIERALRCGWPIPDEWKGRLMSRQAKIALSKNSSPRESTAATKAILAAEKLNLDSIALVIKAQEGADLAEGGMDAGSIADALLRRLGPTAPSDPE